MLIILLSWIYILFVSFVYGHALINLLGSIIKKQPKTGFAVHVISGFAVLTAFSSYISLFLRIGLEVNLVVLLLVFVYIFLQLKKLKPLFFNYIHYLQQSPRSFYVIALAAITIGLIISASPNARYDDGLYYRQAIKWIEEYPAVAGLGNLHLKFSFNSGWHVLSALFSFSFLDLQLNDLNGLLLVVVTLFALEGLMNIVKQNYGFSDIFKVATIAPLHLLYTYIISPSPDLVIPYLCWVIFALFIEKTEKQKLAVLDINSLLILLFSVFAVVIKLSAAPLALLSVYLLFLQLRQKNYQVLMPVIGIMLLMFVPWLARNIILSGYLIYPFYQLDVLSVDWKIPAELVKLELMETKSFAKIRRMLYTDVAQMKLTEWLPYWFWELRTIEKILVAFILLLSLVLPFAVIHSLLKTRITQQKIGMAVLLLTLYSGIIFWFFTAPHFRYGMGFTVGLYLLFMSYVFYRSIKRYQFLTLPLLIGFVLVFMGKPLYDVINWYRGREYRIIPGEAPNYEIKLIYYKDIEIYVPKSNNAQCWEAPLPCAPFVVDGLEMRSGNLRDGFRVTEPEPDIYAKKRLESMKENIDFYNILDKKTVQ